MLVIFCNQKKKLKIQDICVVIRFSVTFVSSSSSTK